MKILLSTLILLNLISCNKNDAVKAANNGTTTDTTTPTAKTFSCLDNDNIYHKWKRVDTPFGYDVTLDLRAYTVNARTTHIVQYDKHGSIAFSQANYDFEFTGNGCSGDVIVANPTAVVGLIDWSTIVFKDGVETYEVLNEGAQLKLCDGGTCHTYNKI